MNFMPITEQNELCAFHGDIAVKNKFIDRVNAHYEADQIIRGRYWSDDDKSEVYRGCAVGCTIHSQDHFEYVEQLAIPEWVAWAEDAMFEQMSTGHETWPLRFLAAIPVGFNDWARVWHKMALYILCDSEVGINYKMAKVEGERICSESTQLQFEEIIDFHRRALAGGSDQPSDLEWEFLALSISEQYDRARKTVVKDYEATFDMEPHLKDEGRAARADSSAQTRIRSMFYSLSHKHPNTSGISTLIAEQVNFHRNHRPVGAVCFCQRINHVARQTVTSYSDYLLNCFTNNADDS